MSTFALRCCTRLAVALSLLAGGAGAETIDPEGTGQRWAWAENAGWVDAQPGGPGSVGLHAEAGIVTGWLWAPNLGWVSAHCSNTDSCGQVDYGLQLAPDPDLPGYLRLGGSAWSENAGWIVADCASTASCGEVDYALRVHLESGLVDGWAWSENLGWLSFSCANSGSCASVSFGLQFDPAALGPLSVDLFQDGFEG